MVYYCRSSRLLRFSCVVMRVCMFLLIFFFFNDTATTEIYTLSLHDALPISPSFTGQLLRPTDEAYDERRRVHNGLIDRRDRKSTRLNSSHLVISYAVFCLKKKYLRNIYSSHCTLLTCADCFSLYSIASGFRR